MKQENKKINVEISYECWKKLKMMSIDKDITLQEVIKNVLDKFVGKKVSTVEEVTN